MDWKIFFATFSAIFFAEFADKTQLVGVLMSAKTKNYTTVWLGSVAAYIVATTIAIIIGAIAGKNLPTEVIRYVGGILFMGVGLLMVCKIL